MTQLEKVRALIPRGNGIRDSISCLGGRQQLTVDVLEKALHSYFDGTVRVRGNDIHVKHPVASKEDAVCVYFSGALDAIIEDHKFALVVRRAACSAGVTMKRADGTEVMSHAIRDVDGLLAVLDEFWPEKK